jgi:hypothetical protein
MLFREIISAYSENLTKHVSVLCQQNEEHFIHKTRGTYCYHCSVGLQVNVVFYEPGSICTATAGAVSGNSLTAKFPNSIKDKGFVTRSI